MKYIKYEIENQIATITINRPDVLNALNKDLIDELGLTIDNMMSAGDARVLIITGEGKNFAAGADIAQMIEMNPAQARTFTFNDVYCKIEALPIPVFAAINGFALGGGLELSLACDFRICSSKAKLGLPEINLGIFPGAGGTQRLPKLIGSSRAKEMIYFGSIIDAEKAYELGLCQWVVEEDPLQHSLALAEKLIKKSSVALEAAKKAIDYGIDKDLSSGITFEAIVWSDLFSTADQKEGMRAFLEKRKPDFKGE